MFLFVAVLGHSPGRQERTQSPPAGSSTVKTIVECEYPSIRAITDEQSCDSWGSIPLPDGGYIIMDFNNHSIKRLSQCLRITDQLTLIDAPYAGCYNLTRREVAVTLRERKVIQFVTVEEDAMVVTRQINTVFRCGGIDCYEDQIFCIEWALSGGRSIYKFDWTSGDSQGEIVPRDSVGNALLDNPKQSRVNENGSRIYVAEYRKGLVIMDNTGAIITVVKGLYYTIGLCLGDEGCVFVAGRGHREKHVLQYDRDGRHLRTMVSHGHLSHLPVALSYTRSRAELFVTMHLCDVAGVFRLQ